MTQQINDYKGFALFNDVEDAVLRSSNRGTVLSNIAQDNTRNDKISPKGASLILGYFSQIPKEERQEVEKAFIEVMTTRGYEFA